jgi:hypothetical protein
MSISIQLITAETQKEHASHIMPAVEGCAKCIRFLFQIVRCCLSKLYINGSYLSEIQISLGGNSPRRLVWP